jgi:lipoyl(octanoyl) transferase
VSNWNFESHWKGRLPYQEAWDLQLRIAAQRKVGAVPDQILGLEHPYVITLGKRSKTDPEIPAGPVVWVDRGGEATLHSEGQLVIYPLVRLRPRFEVRTWVDFLHEVSIRAFARVGVETFRGENSGLWTSRGKIAFLGLRIKEGVSLHGLSLNVRNDLALFAPMKSCGVRSAAMDSLACRGIDLSPEEFFRIWAEEFEASCQGRNS